MLNGAWVDSQIYTLTAILAASDNTYRSNFYLTNQLYDYFKTGKTKDIQLVINLISKQLGFVAPIAQYDWSGKIHDPNRIAGLMTEGRIIIEIGNTGRKYFLAATTIHELMHYTLIHRKNFILPNTTDNEKITDLAAMVLGFGNIVLNGKITPEGGLGHLSEEEALYAYHKLSELRHVNTIQFLTRDVVNSIKQKVSQDKKQKKHEMANEKLRQSNIRNAILSERISRFFSWPFKKAKKMMELRNLPKKKCPYCYKSIPDNYTRCPFCNRVVVERISG